MCYTLSGKPSGVGVPLGCVHCYDGCSKWEDTSCAYSRAFVCKMPANIPAGYRNKGSAPISTKFGQNFDIVKCPKGTYNSDVQPPSFVACKNCPAGKFGDTEGLGKEACSGACAAGYYCKEGSTTNKYAPCLAGTYGSSQGLKTSACDGLCPAGYVEEDSCTVVYSYIQCSVFSVWRRDSYVPLKHVICTTGT